MFSAFVLAAALDTASPAPSPADTPSPNQIYYRAFARLATYPLPPYAVWTDLFKTTARMEDPDDCQPPHVATSVAVTRYAARTSDEMESFSADRNQPGLLPDAIIANVFQGPFAWTMRPSTAKRKTLPGATPGAEGPDLSALKVIASVTAYEKPPYTIVLLGTEKVDGRDSYHLGLKPLSEPKVHNLRELWVDEGTFDILKAHYIGNYAPVPTAPNSPSEIVSYFKAIAKYWIVYRMVWTYRDQASFTFDAETMNIAFPDELPDWIFDPIAYPAHVRAQDPDVLYYVLHGLPVPSPSPSPGTR